MEKRNIRITTQFDGTDFCGWQSQKNGRAVQDVLTEALHTLTGEDINLIGCSRTDAGVHAAEHVSNFSTCSSIPTDRITYAMNALLPSDVSVTAASEVNADFHARFDTKGKHYRYCFQTADAPRALWSRYAFFMKHRQLDEESMKSAAPYFEGKHDFAGFMSAGSTVKSTVRTLWRCEVSRLTPEVLALDVEGDGFLYNMVRIIAGTLAEVGEGKISCEDIPEIIASCERNNAGRTLPPQGLMLMKVFY